MSAQNLQIQLSRLSGRTKRLGWARAVFWAAFTLVAVLFAWGWMDLLIDAPAAVRIAGWAAALGAAGAVLAMQIQKSAAEWNADHLARRLDAAAGAKGQIVSGFDLVREVRVSAGSPEGLTRGLAFLAANRAGDLAIGARLEKAAPARPAKQAGLALFGILMVIGLLGLIAPGLLGRQWSRLTDPFGDHPVFSEVQIHVQPGNVKVIYGGDLDIRATVSGGAVDRLEAVLVSPGGGGSGARQEETVPMYADAAGQWRTTLAGLTAPGAYYVRAHQTRSERFSIDLITVPAITEVTAKITAPAYTHLPPREMAIPPEGISALPQTVVEFTARSNRPLSGGTLRLMDAKGSEDVALAPGGDPSQVKGSFTVKTGGKISLSVTDTANQKSVDDFSTTLNLLVDQRPIVRIAEPRAQSYATPNAKLPVEILAEDDYGISAVTLYRALNDSRALGIDLPVNKDALRQRSDTTLLLAGLGLKPGDTIRLTGRAQDNDPAGAKGSESDPVLVQIISQEDYNRMMLARAGLEMLLSKYEQAQRRLESEGANLRKLKDELSREAPGAPLNDKLRQEANDIGDAAEKDANDTDDTLGLKLPFDLDARLAPYLQGVAGKLHDLSSQLRQGTPKADTVKDELALINGLIDGLNQEQKDFADHAGAPLDYLSKIYPLIADEEKFVQLYQRENGLAQRLVGMTDNPDDPREKARLHDMEDEQRHIREALDGLLDQIREDAKAVPDDPKIADFRKSAWDFSDAVGRSNAPNHMSDAELALGEFWGKQAQAQADAAAAAMKDFIAGGGSGMEKLAEDALKFQPALAGELGDTVSQLLAAGGLGGGGYAMAGDNPENVGLYGSMPLGMNQAGAGNQGGVLAGGSVAGTAAPGSEEGAGGNAAAGGTLEVPIPPQYRRRVEDYFQRVTDELQKE